MRPLFAFLLLLLYLNGIHAQQPQDSVTIRGRVTDYNGQPIDSCTICWQSPSFNGIKEALTDANGHYTARIPKGKYQSMAAINIATYPHTARPGLADSDQRLEFWAWDFIADRDTTLDIRYHRMEVYGLRVFCIPGATPAYQIYVRPMSLTRFLQWQTETKQKTQHGENVSDIEQQSSGKTVQEEQLAPRPDRLKVCVWIDGEEVPILMKQEIKEYFSANSYGNGYLLTVDRPRQPKQGLPYLVFKVELEDMDNGDRGEGLYYMEKETYIK